MTLAAVRPAIALQLESLRRMVEDISSELELQPLLTRIVEHACALIGADDGTIGLYEAQHDVFRTAAVYRMPERELGAVMARGVGLAGAVLKSGQAVMVRYGDLPFATLPELADNHVIGLPILWHGELIGFFGIGALPPKRFDEHDLELLSLFARHAAIAIANARRYREEQRRTTRLQLISRVARIIGSDLDLDVLLQNAADAIHDVLDFPNVDIPQLDPLDPDYMIVRVRGGDYKAAIVGDDRIPVARGIMGAAVREKRTQLVNAVLEDPRYVCPPGVIPSGAELAAPIILGGEVLGVINVEGRGPFDELDQTSLETIADHLAVAIANARRFHSEQRRTARLALIARVARIIGSGLDIDVTLQNAADAIHELLAYPSVDIPLLDPLDPNTLVVRARGGDYKKSISGEERFPVARGIMGAAVREKRTHRINDTRQDPRYYCPPGVTPYRAELVVPIVLGGEVLGVVNVEGDWPLDDLDQTSLETVADHLGVAIANARLYAAARKVAVLTERQRLARELHDSVTQILSSINLIAQTLVPAWQRDPIEGARRTGRLHELAQTAFAEMRALLRELQPAEQATAHISKAGRAFLGLEQLKYGALPAALTRMLGAMVPEHLTLKLDLGSWHPQRLEHEEALFRICQEAVSNVVRHSGAKRIEISAAVLAETALLRIADDGRGLPENLVRGIGLDSMRQRVEGLTGQFRISTRTPRGTLVEARLPRIDRELPGS